MEDSLPTCPVCLDEFSDPRLLQCGHCMCMNCIRIVPFKSGHLTCPLCKQLTSCSSIDALPKNFALLETIDMMKDLLKPKEAEKKKCTQHAGQELDLICTTCSDLPVCAKCLLVGSHKGHDHIALEEYETARKKISAVLTRKNNITARLKGITEAYARLCNHAAQVRVALEDYSVKINQQKLDVDELASEVDKQVITPESDTAKIEEELLKAENVIIELSKFHYTSLNSVRLHTLALSNESTSLEKLVSQPFTAPAPAPATTPVAAPVAKPAAASPIRTTSPAIVSSLISSPMPSPMASPMPSPAHTPSPSPAPDRSSAPSPSFSSATSSTTSSATSSPQISRPTPNVTSTTSSREVEPQDHETIMIVGGMNLTTFDNVLVHKQGAWTEIAPLSVKRTNTAAVFDRRKQTLYVIGGNDDRSTVLTSCVKYDFNERIWRSIPELSYPRANHSVVHFEGNIWAIGGMSGGSATDTVECISSSSLARWVRGSNLPYARNFHASVVCEADSGSIFTIGGSIGMERVRTAAVCNNNISSWRQIAPMLVARSGLAAACLGKSVYALGGFDGKVRLNSVEVYHTDEGSWKTIAPMTSPRVWFGAVTHNEKIYALGGFDGKTRLKSIECFEPRTGTWELLNEISLPYPTSGFGCTRG